MARVVIVHPTILRKARIAKFTLILMNLNRTLNEIFVEIFDNNVWDIKLPIKY